MAFVAIDTNEIDVGDALKKELFDKTKENFDDHESRINETEVGAKKVNVFNYVVMNAASSNSFTGLDYFVANENFTLTSAILTIFETGSLTGSIEIDVKKSTTDLDGTSFTSVFTTKPSVDLDTASDYASSSNQVFDNNQISVLVGDILRFDVTEMPSSGVMGKFILNVYGEK